ARLGELRRGGERLEGLAPGAPGLRALPVALQLLRRERRLGARPVATGDPGDERGKREQGCCGCDHGRVAATNGLHQSSPLVRDITAYTTARRGMMPSIRRVSRPDRPSARGSDITASGTRWPVPVEDGGPARGR